MGLGYVDRKIVKIQPSSSCVNVTPITTTTTLAVDLGRLVQHWVGVTLNYEQLLGQQQGHDILGVQGSRANDLERVKSRSESR